MYTELFDTPPRRLLAHTLITLMGVGALVVAASLYAGQVRWHQAVQEATFKVEQTSQTPLAALDVERAALYHLRLHSPTVHQSWVDLRVQIVGEEDGRAALDERVYLSHRVNLYQPKQGAQGQTTRELFVWLPAGRWRVMMTGEAPADRSRGMFVGGGLKMGPDGQMIWEPGTWMPSLPIWPNDYPVARDEIVEVTITQDAVMSRHGAMLLLLAGALLAFFAVTRADQTQSAREAHVARVNLALQAALNHTFPGAPPPAATRDEDDAPLRFELALGAAVLIVLTSAAVVLASVWGLPGPF